MCPQKNLDILKKDKIKVDDEIHTIIFIYHHIHSDFLKFSFAV